MMLLVMLSATLLQTVSVCLFGVTLLYQGIEAEKKTQKGTEGDPSKAAGWVWTTRMLPLNGFIDCLSLHLRDFFGRGQSLTGNIQYPVFGSTLVDTSTKPKACSRNLKNKQPNHILSNTLGETDSIGL